MKVILQTLTPVHVGVSQEKWWQKNIDFLQTSDKIYLLDIKDIFAQLKTEEEQNNFVANLSNGKLNEFNDYLIKQRKLDLNTLAYKVFEFKDGNAKEIRPVMRTADRLPMIPSSSIKGSVRTSFLKYLIRQKADFARKRENLGSHRGDRFQFSDRRLQQNYLGNDAKTDLFRLVRFGDFYFNKTECVKLQILNLMSRSDWNYKSDQFSHIECISKNQTAQSSLEIPQHLLKQVSTKGKINHTSLLTSEKICQIIQENTLELIESELSFWEDQDNLPLFLDDYLEILEEIKTQVENCKTNEAILRVGGGSGWDFMTGAWAKGDDAQGNEILDNHTWQTLKNALRRRRYDENTTFPKTRKLTHRHEPLGFVKMTIS